MADWLEWAIGATVLVLAVVLVVAPTSGSGRRLLRTWGVEHPSDGQAAAASSYLLWRRVLAVVLFLGLKPVASAFDLDDLRETALQFVVPLVVAMLVAELIAVLRPAGGVRSASLDPRGWRDFVPRWAVAAVAVLVVLAVAWSVAGLVAQPWASRYAAALSEYESAPPHGVRAEFADGYLAELATTTGWLTLGYTAAALGLVVLVVRLAVRRPAVADEAVDTALRTRTARVAVGLGLAWLSFAVLVATGRIDRLGAEVQSPTVPDVPAPAWLSPGLGTVSELVGLAALLGAVGCWIWVANPTRRSLAATRR